MVPFPPLAPSAIDPADIRKESYTVTTLSISENSFSKVFIFFYQRRRLFLDLTA
jgi:hypothetical protein